MAYISNYTGQEHDEYVSKSSLINLIYPVGAIYISINSTSPEILFGGTWEAFAEGKTIIGVDVNSTNNYASSENTGGNSSINLAHSHTVNSHTHGLSSGYAKTNGWSRGEVTYYEVNTPSWTVNYGFNVSSVGSRSGSSTYGTQLGGDSGAASPQTNSQLSSEQSIINPYITVYMWKRTA